MMKVRVNSAYLFRFPSEKKAIEKPIFFVEDKTEDKKQGKGEHILCRQCLKIITNPAEIIAVEGSHQHTFTNPQGVLFQIGCFRLAEGCAYLGPSTEEWSWFRGFSWRISVCRKCLTHLGWLYTSPGTESFHGLIRDRLIGQNDWS